MADPDGRSPGAQPWGDEVEAASVPYQGGAFWALALVGALSLPVQALARLGRLVAGALRSRR